MLKEVRYAVSAGDKKTNDGQCWMEQNYLNGGCGGGGHPLLEPGAERLLKETMYTVSAPADHLFRIKTLKKTDRV